MNKKRMAAILADSAVVARLQRCTTAKELVLCLNREGAECTREEGIRFLRVWEKVTADREFTENTETTGEDRKRHNGLAAFLRRVFRPSARARGDLEERGAASLCENAKLIQ